jgi:protein-L-isoaspartate(D-aspartate) O-methyltransferase
MYRVLCLKNLFKGFFMEKSSALRRMMVDAQIRTFDVTHQDVLAAFCVVPRELFVEEAFAGVAYSDASLFVPTGTAPRSLLKPMILARLLQALDVQPQQQALTVGGGYGYAAALLAQMGCHVTHLESSSPLCAEAEVRLKKAGYPQVQVVCAPLSQGVPAQYAGAKRFDAIVVEGAFEQEPRVLLEHLNEGGQLVGIHAATSRGASQPSCAAVLYHNQRGVFGHRALFNAAAPVLEGFARKPEFVF